MQTIDIEKTLKDKGYRKSLVRDNIILVLTKKHPVSADIIIKELNKQNINPNKTSVYRDLETLLKEQIITEIDLLDGKKRYELMHDQHHHHTVCTQCNDITCIDLKNDLDFMENQIEKQNNFKVTGHFLEFFGVCKNCQKG